MMMFIVGSVTYLWLLCQVKTIRDNLMITKKGYQRLLHQVKTYVPQKVVTPWLTLLKVLLGLMMVSFLFKLNYSNLVVLSMGVILVFPLVYLPSLKAEYYELEFQSLHTYLQHMLLLFKEQSKIHQCMLATAEIVEGKIQQLCLEAAKQLELSDDMTLALKPIEQAYPHFIVINLHRFLVHAQTYGNQSLDTGISILQDGVDDWYDAIYQFKGMQKTLRKRLQLLCAMSLGIAYFAITTFQQIGVSVDHVLYQSSVLILIGFNMLTLGLIQQTKGRSWLSKDELI